MHTGSSVAKGLGALIYAALLIGCDSHPAQDQVRLSQSDGEHWSVSYRLVSPASGITLVRSPDNTRALRWRITSSGFEIVQIDNRDVIRRQDGSLFSEVEVLVPTTYVALRKDYAPFSRFSDGGLLIHSGRFHFCSNAAFDSADDCNGPWLMQLVPPKGTHALLHGELHEKPVDWLDTGDGTTLYVGASATSEFPGFVAIVDRGLPVQLSEPLTELFPALMAHYEQVLPRLRYRPTLFVSYDPLHADGYGNQGGTLPAQIFMHFYGPGWSASGSDVQSPEDLAWFFAHEVGHLFQHGVSGEADASWIHEGAAEAFAFLALESLNAASGEFLERRRDRALNGCRDALQGGTLASAAQRGEFAGYYDCGLVMNLAIDAATRTSTAGQHDLFSLWTRLIDTTEDGVLWRNDRFLEMARTETGDALTEQLRAVIFDEQVDPASAVLQLQPM